jgi:hypothetical protein
VTGDLKSPFDAAYAGKETGNAEGGTVRAACSSCQVWGSLSHETSPFEISRIIDPV